jgi:hypothetical protein
MNLRFSESLPLCPSAISLLGRGIMALTVDPKKLKLHPANLEIYQTRKEEDEELRDSIREHGILEPLVVNSQNVIISGARRWKVALDLGLKEVPYRVVDPEDEELAIIEYNRYRQKTPLELYKEYQIIKRKEGSKAEERMKAGKVKTQDPESEMTQGRVRDQAAKELNVSSGKLYQIEYVYDRKDREEVKPIVEKLNKGRISVLQAYEQAHEIETPQADTEPKTWKCGACQREFADDALENPVTRTLCPYCEIEFQRWCAENEFGQPGST